MTKHRIVVSVSLEFNNDDLNEEIFWERGHSWTDVLPLQGLPDSAIEETVDAVGSFILKWKDKVAESDAL